MTPSRRKGSRILRWLGRIGLGFLALIALVLVAGAITEVIGQHNARKNFPPRGAMVDIGGRRMHLDCRGHGAPTVVLESGLDTNGSLAWVAVQDKIAGTTRVCSYDRAGIMWSDPKSTPQNADAVAQDLHATLAKAGETGPFVMVGHSLGGPYIMDYTRQYGDQVAGLVFVDASHPDQLKRMAQPKTDLTPVLKFLAWARWTGWTRVLPLTEAQPNVPAATASAANAYTSTSMPAAIAENDALKTSLAQGGQLRTLGARPLVVLTAMKPLPDATLKLTGMTRAQADLFQAEWKALHDDEATWSTRSRHQIVPDSTHYIQIERPDIVVAAVSEVVAQVRADSAHPRAKP